MVSFFSRHRGYYIAQYTSKGGTLYTGTGTSFADAIFRCLKVINEYAPYETA